MGKVGFIGLGAMGRPMARRLVAAGSDVRCFDVVQERVDELRGLGAAGAASPAEAVHEAEIVVVMVATPEQATEAVFGDHGAASSLAADSVLVVTSTVGPQWVAEAATELAGRGVSVLDAPVSGGVVRAGAGELLMMVSGPPAVLERARGVLDAVASTIADCGDEPGLAQSVKLVNQLLCGVHIAVAGEALAFATSMGLDARQVFDTVRHGAAASFMLDDRGSRMVAGEFEDPKSALDIFVKDLGLVTEAARSGRFPALLASTAEQVFRMGTSMGLGRLDDASVVRVFEQWAGGAVAAPPSGGASQEDRG